MAEPATPPTFPPKAAPVPVASLADFHDRLSPMLVKELRQGLRAKTFVSVFLMLQIFLVFVLLATTTITQGGMNISLIIFFFFSIAALIIQPLRGIGALHTEIKGNTIELMVLTRLNARGIVLGKWISIYAQTALLFVAIIPYLILRYFFGGMQLFSELFLITGIFFLSGIFTCVTIGISAVPSVIIRGLFPLVCAIGVLTAILNLSSVSDYSRMLESIDLNSSDFRWSAIALVACGLYLGWSSLNLGASMIAPSAENRSTPQRLIALGSLLVASIATLIIQPQNPLPYVGVSLFLIFTSVTLSISEPFDLVPPVCQRFLRLGRGGLFAGRFLYPGWPSGTLFSIMMMGLPFAVLALVKQDSPQTGSGIFSIDEWMESLFGLLTSVGTISFCIALLGLMSGKVKNRFPVFLFLLITSGVTAIILKMVSMAINMKGLLWAFCWIPPVYGLLRAEHSAASLLPGLTVLTCAYFAIALFLAVRQFGRISEVERAATPPATP